MKKLELLLIISLCAVFSFLGAYSAKNDDKSFVIKNNNTRDFAYEHYCDSIYEHDKEYYHDVLVESDKFQSYIEEHGEWWTN